VLPFASWRWAASPIPVGISTLGRYIDALNIEPRGGISLTGLCDAAEEDYVRDTLARAGFGRARSRAELSANGFYVCDADGVAEPLPGPSAPGFEVPNRSSQCLYRRPGRQFHPINSTNTVGRFRAGASDGLEQAAFFVTASPDPQLPNAGRHAHPGVADPLAKLGVITVRSRLGRHARDHQADFATGCGTAIRSTSMRVGTAPGRSGKDAVLSGVLRTSNA
jgi:hypothetical protein